MEVDELKVERLAKTQDPLALTATSNNPYNFPVPYQDQPSFNQNYMQQPMPNLEDITDPTTAMNIALALMAKAFKLNYSTPTNNNQRILSNPRNRQIAQLGMNMGQDRQMQMVGGNANQNGNGTLVAARAQGNATGHNGNQIRCYNYRGVADLDEIEEVNANCILMANLQQASTSAKFVGDFKSLAKEADESLAKHKALELEIERLLKAVVSQDIMSVVQNNSIVDTSNLQTELERTKNALKIVSLKKRTSMLNFGMIGTKEFQVLNYAKENAYLKTTYKNLFDSISVSQTQTKTIIASMQHELQNTIYENAKLRAQLFKKVSIQKDNTRGTSTNTKFAKQSILEKPPTLGETHALSKPVTLNSIPTPQESKVVNNDKKNVNSESNGLSSTRVDNTKTRRPQPRSNKKNDRVPSASKSSCNKNKKVKVEEHHRNLLLFKNKKHMSSACNNVKFTTQDVKVVCAMCKQCLISANHDVCLLNYVNGKISHGKIIASNESESQSDCSKSDNACTSNPMEPTIKRFPNSTFSLAGTARFRNDHVAAIMGFGDLQWGNILITRVYFVEGLGHNLFSVGQFCDSDLEVGFRRNACFIRNLEGVDLLKGGLPKFKYHKEHFCPSCEQGKSKRASHLPKLIPNSRQRLHLLHMDLCGPMRIDSINGSAIATVCFTQNRSIIHRRFNKTPYELINSKKPDISFLHVFGALCYPKNDRDDIGKLGAKGDIGFFIGYFADSCAYRIYNQRTKKIMETMKMSFDELSAMAFEQRSSKPGLQSDIGFFIGYFADSCAYRIYNQRTKKIMETMKMSFDELSAMAFEQRSSKPGLQSMTSGQISSGLDLTYAPSTITTQQPTEGELDLLFKDMYDDYIGGQPSATQRSVTATQVQQVRQTSTTSTSIEDTASMPTNSSSHATNFPISSQDVDELNSQQHVQQQGNQALLQPKTVAGNVPNAMFNANSFVNPFATPSTSDAESSSSQNVDPSNMHTFYQPYPHEFQWTKDHPLEQGSSVDMQLVNTSPQVVHEDGLTLIDKLPLKKDVYVCQLEGFIDVDHPSHVYKLKKALYGLKQAPRAWYDELSKFLLQNHFFKGTIDPALFIRLFDNYILVDYGFELTGFSDADYAGCKDTFKSTLGRAQFLGEKLLTDYGFNFKKIQIYCDSKSAISISCNPVQHLRTNHIAIRYHFIKEHVEKGMIKLYFVKTDYQLADIFTKALPADRFNYLVRRHVPVMRTRKYGESNAIALEDLIHSAENPVKEVLLKLNLPIHRIRRWRYNLTPAESRFKTPCLIIKNKYMMKAQVHVSKSSAISDVQALL
nr:hypothetical protein [Tanacetum cinerariifolium]